MKNNNNNNNSALVVIFILLIVVLVLVFVFKDKLFAAGMFGTQKQKTTVVPIDEYQETGKGNNGNRSKFPLRLGNKGEEVKLIQYSVGAIQDGIWGPKTNAAVFKKYGVYTIDLPLYNEIRSFYSSY